MSHKAHLEDVEGSKPVSEKVKDVYRSWHLFFTHPIRNAGLGLACLYMTVLGFDNITVGYCLHQCVPSSVLGALMGISSVFGIAGSVSFPYIR